MMGRLHTGSLAIFAAIRRASSLLSNFAAERARQRVSALSFPILRVAPKEAGVVRAAGCHHRELTVW